MLHESSGIESILHKEDHLHAPSTPPLSSARYSNNTSIIRILCSLLLLLLFSWFDSFLFSVYYSCIEAQS
jgi:hypothetical protein